MDFADMEVTDTKPTGPFGVKVGDVFVASWGYDQTNVDAFVVVRVMSASVAIMGCPQRAVGEGHSTKMVPAPELGGVPFGTDRYHVIDGTPNAAGEIIKRVNEGYGGKPSIRFASFANAYLWDGERSYFDTIAAGYPGH